MDDDDDRPATPPDAPLLPFIIPPDVIRDLYQRSASPPARRSSERSKVSKERKRQRSPSREKRRSDKHRRATSPGHSRDIPAWPSSDLPSSWSDPLLSQSTDDPRLHPSSPDRRRDKSPDAHGRHHRPSLPSSPRRRQSHSHEHSPPRMKQSHGDRRDRGDQREKDDREDSHHHNSRRSSRERRERQSSSQLGKRHSQEQRRQHSKDHGREHNGRRSTDRSHERSQGRHGDSGRSRSKSDGEEMNGAHRDNGVIRERQRNRYDTRQDMWEMERRSQPQGGEGDKTAQARVAPRQDGEKGYDIGGKAVVIIKSVPEPMGEPFIRTCLQSSAGVQPKTICVVPGREGSPTGRVAVCEFDAAEDAWRLMQHTQGVLKLGAEGYGLPLEYRGPRNTSVVVNTPVAPPAVLQPNTSPYPLRTMTSEAAITNTVLGTSGGPAPPHQGQPLGYLPPVASDVTPLPHDPQSAASMAQHNSGEWQLYIAAQPSASPVPSDTFPPTATHSESAHPDVATALRSYYANWERCTPEQQSYYLQWAPIVFQIPTPTATTASSSISINPPTPYHAAMSVGMAAPMTPTPTALPNTPIATPTPQLPPTTPHPMTSADNQPTPYNSLPVTSPSISVHHHQQQHQQHHHHHQQQQQHQQHHHHYQRPIALSSSTANVPRGHPSPSPLPFPRSISVPSPAFPPHYPPPSVLPPPPLYHPPSHPTSNGSPPNVTPVSIANAKPVINADIAAALQRKKERLKAAALANSKPASGANTAKENGKSHTPISPISPEPPPTQITPADQPVKPDTAAPRNIGALEKDLHDLDGFLKQLEKAHTNEPRNAVPEGQGQSSSSVPIPSELQRRSSEFKLSAQGIRKSVSGQMGTSGLSSVHSSVVLVGALAGQKSSSSPAASPPSKSSALAVDIDGFAIPLPVKKSPQS